MKQKIPVWLVGAVVIAVVAAAGYWFGIRPKGEELTKVDEKIASLEIQLAAAERLAAAPEEPGSERSAIRVADLVRLAKAIPDETDMAGIILELNAAATAAGVQFAEIQPGIPIPGNGYTAIPISLAFEGSYYNLTELVFSLRNLVTVRDGVLDADGRLITVDGVSLQEGVGGFPEIRAVLQVSAYQYGVDSVGALLEAGGAQAPPAEGTTTTGTTPSDGTSTTGTAPAEGTATTGTAPATGTVPSTTAPTDTTGQAAVDTGSNDEQQAMGGTP